MIKVKITVNGQVMTANFEENATTAALLAQMPMQLPMLNLYSRELTYRFEQALPANEARTAGYTVGDIAYWTPRHSFVIFYKQTGEVISGLQKVGHINGGDFKQFQSAGNPTMTFEKG
ncbi:cyclophilin-like fold protein [Levilactobacillus namurensis]|uniref:cyclophilin-like fold protein n=1 Tax=Levilactobacillus namurensis TaxID=380393 RepID=UPI0026EAD386|nr:cyclophilin-like fold protein [Levilactobacillus namurensis]